MSSFPNQPGDLRDDALPDALADDLRALYARDVRVPTSLDAAILQDARAGFARRRRFRLALRGAALATGAAAAAAVLVLALRPLTPDSADPQGPMARHAEPTATSPVVARAEDVDRSGKVDILDAFVVAKLVDLQGHLDNQAYDVNGDGKVDRSDVDRIAVAAVETTAPRTADEDGRVQ